jgi:hypothetical protein
VSDGLLHIHSHRTTRSFDMEYSEEKPVSRDDQMGLTQRRCTSNAKGSLRLIADIHVLRRKPSNS